MSIDYTPLAPPGWFSRLKIEPLNDDEYEGPSGEKLVVGRYMIRAERSSDNACFYAIMSLRESLVGIEKERLAEFIEEKIKHCFYTLERVSGALDRKDGVPSAEEIKESIGAFDAPLFIHTRSNCGKSKYADKIDTVRKVFSEFVEVYGAKVA